MLNSIGLQGIVFVSYNYRLSLFAYPHSEEMARAGETQNLGLLDTRFAIQWVWDNIQNFGGDPEKMTLGGESVGAGEWQNNNQNGIVFDLTGIVWLHCLDISVIR